MDTSNRPWNLKLFQVPGRSFSVFLLHVRDDMSWMIPIEDGSGKERSAVENLTYVRSRIFLRDILFVVANEHVIID